MKHFLAVLSLVFLVSCGQSGGSDAAREEEQERGFAEVGREAPDLLNVTLDVPIVVSSDQIQFLKSREMMDQGSRTICQFKVSEGEAWRYSLNGGGLSLETPSGMNLSMRQTGAQNNGVFGVWTWRGVSDGMKVIRRLTILENRLILNQDCES